MSSDLIDQLARLPCAEMRVAAAKAKAKRKRAIAATIRQIRRTILEGLGDRAAARVIDDVVRGRKVRLPASLRDAVQQALEKELGCLDDIARDSRIRQIFKE